MNVNCKIVLGVFSVIGLGITTRSIAFQRSDGIDRHTPAHPLVEEFECSRRVFRESLP